MLTLFFRSLSLQKCTETISGRIGTVFLFMALFLLFFSPIPFFLRRAMLRKESSFRQSSETEAVSMNACSWDAG